MPEFIHRFSWVRRFAWRLGRKLYFEARGDLANDPERNGEYWLLDRFLDLITGEAVLLDVGANMGAWTLRALRHPNASRLGAVHAFEPDSGTRRLLVDRLTGRQQVLLHPQALCAHRGEATFYSSGPGAGTNSLIPTSGTETERVPLVTLDDVLDEYALSGLVMVKVDTEGFDLDVISGGANALRDGRIEVLQFEYNWRWLQNHACLRDVFAFIGDKPYRLGKLVGRHIEFFVDWHFELDRFIENNWVLVRKGSQLERLGCACRFDLSNTVVRAGTVLTKGSTSL